MHQPVIRCAAARSTSDAVRSIKIDLIRNILNVSKTYFDGKLESHDSHTTFFFAVHCVLLLIYFIPTGIIINYPI